MTADLFLRIGFSRAGDAEAGIVDEDVYSAECFYGRVDGGLDLFWIGDVELEGQDLSGVFCFKVVELLRVTGGGGDFCAVFENGFGEAAAETA